MVENTCSNRTDWHRRCFREPSQVCRKAEKRRPHYVEVEARNNNYDKTVGSETITLYTTEFVVSQIEFVTAKGAEARD